MDNFVYEDINRDLHDLDMWNVLVFIWKIQKQSFDPDVQAKAVSKKFNISVYYAKALLKRIEEMERGRDIDLRV